MPTTTQAFSRDANRVPIVLNGLMVTKSYTFSSTGTLVIPIFSITGTVQLLALYGVVTTVLAGNHRVGAFRINDQTAQVQITSATGPTMDAAPVGSLIIADVLAATAASYKSSAAGAVLQPATAGINPFSGSIITQKTGSIETDIEYRFTSSTNPTTGAMKFYCGFVPLSDDGNVTAVA
jgi:hypothetical protein